MALKPRSTLPVPMISVTSCPFRQHEQQLCFSAGAYARVVRLKQRNLDALLLEEALRLSEVQWSVVWRSVPAKRVSTTPYPLQTPRNVPIGQEGDLVGRHVDAVIVNTPSRPS